MTRHSNADLDRLKRTIPIRELVEAHGVKLVRRGADWHGCCPFHDDRTPSLVVSPKKNLWHCLGACKAGGSVIDWVMKAEGLSFLKAVEDLQKREGILSGKGNAPAEEPELKAAASRSPEEQALLNAYVRYHHQRLKETPKALAYLAEQRQLTAPEMVEAFQIGFVDHSFLDTLPAKTKPEGLAIREQLARLGLVNARGLEPFGGFIIFPLFDERGDVAGLYGRRVNPKHTADAPVHRYLPGPHRAVFNAEAFASPELILCEAVIDALTFWCAGFRNVSTSYGIEGFTAHHVEMMKRQHTRRVLIAYDRDEAGDRGADALAKRLLAEGIEAYRIEFPKGMDANTYAKTLKPAEKSLGLLLHKARWMGDGPAPDHRPTTAAVIDLSPELPTLAPASTPEVNPSLAAPAPSAPTPTGPTPELRGEEVIIQIAERRYRARGLFKNTSPEVMKLNLLASRGDRFYVDQLDLYAGRQRAAFIKHGAEELGLDELAMKADVGRVLLALEGLYEQHLNETLKPKDQAVVLTAEEEAEALAFLKDPNVLDRILSDFERAGVVGEEVNKLAAYLAAVSRKLEDPLAVIIQSSSAAGKTSLMEAVLAFMPEEDRVKYSAMTGQSLFYMGESNLKHKILAIVEEEGAERAAYALKLLQSEKELTIASTGKDPTTGRLITHEYKVEGPVMIFLTTTSVSIDEELLNRAIVLSVDEHRHQTQAIHRLQRRRETLDGLLDREERRKILKLHQNAQRLLRPLRVANPFAERLTFVDHKTRTRRDHMKYLALIRTVTLLHQFQRPIRTVMHHGQPLEYIEVTVDDIANANEISHQILGRSLDELAPQTRRLLQLLDEMARDLEAKGGVPRADLRFSRKQVREYTGWSYEQVRVHLQRLVEMEHVVTHAGTRGQSYSYELLYDGQGGSGAPFLAGLVDVAELQSLGGKRPSLGSEKPEFGGPLGAHTGPIPGGCDLPKTEPSSSNLESLSAARTRSSKNAQGRTTKNGAANGAHPVVARPA